MQRFGEYHLEVTVDAATSLQQKSVPLFAMHNQGQRRRRSPRDGVFSSSIPTQPEAKFCEKFSLDFVGVLFEPSLSFL
jgi:hypothetical protein